MNFYDDPERNAAIMQGFGAAQSLPINKRKKNFLLDQISTIGGIGGAIGGSFVAPVAGTLAGGAAGSALGETLENILMGDSLGKNVLKEGLIGGVTSVGPIKLAKAGLGLATGARAGATAAAGGIGREAGEQVLKTSVRGKLESAGNKALLSQYGTIGKNVARSTRPDKVIPQLADMGLIKPQDVERVALGITGSDGVLSKAVSGAIGEAGIVPTQGVRSVLKNSIQMNALAGTAEEKALTTMVKANLKSLEKGATPEQVMKVIRNLESRAADFVGKGGNYHLATSLDQQKAAVLNEVKDHLQQQLFDTAGANRGVASILTPAVRDELIALAPGNKKWLAQVERIMQAQDIPTLRSAQAPFVNASKILDEGAMNAMTFGGRVGNRFNGAGTIQGKLMEVGSDLVRDPAARASGQILRGAANGFNGAIGVPTARGIAGRMGAVGAVRGALGGGEAEAQSLESALMQPEQAGSTLGKDPLFYDQADDMGRAQQMAAASPYSQEDLLADIQRDPQNAMEYMKYYQTIDSIFGAGGAGTNLSQGTKNSLASADNAINTLNQLESRFNAAGGGGGRIGGTIKSKMGSLGLNDDARVYDSMANASVTQIAKALAGSGAGTVSDMDAKVIMAALARFGDNPEEARAKFADLRQRLETAKNNSLLYGAGGEGLEDVLMQQQGAYY